MELIEFFSLSKFDEMAVSLISFALSLLVFSCEGKTKYFLKAKKIDVKCYIFSDIFFILVHCAKNSVIDSVIMILYMMFFKELKSIWSPTLYLILPLLSNLSAR